VQQQLLLLQQQRIELGHQLLVLLLQVGMMARQNLQKGKPRRIF
jgi:hypothetical protein